MNLIKFFSNYKYVIFKNVFGMTSVIYGILGFICFFISVGDLIPTYIVPKERFLLGLLFLLSLTIVAFVVDVIRLRFVCNKFCFIKLRNSKHVFIHYGNLFDEKIVDKKESFRNIIIPVNCCFDTKVDKVQISPESLQGMALNLMKEHNITESEVQARIEQSLNIQQNSHENLFKSDKPEGNLKRYREGTVATIDGWDGVRFLFIALVKFDNELHSISPSIKDFYMAFGGLIDNLSRNSEGGPFVLPILGTGLSNTGLQEQDLLEFLLNAIKLHQNMFNTDIHIVVYHEKKNDVSIASALRG